MESLFMFVVMPRLWSVSHRHNVVTPDDFVRGRYGSDYVALAIALTGILTTMPRIALQLVGIPLGRLARRSPCRVSTR